MRFKVSLPIAITISILALIQTVPATAGWQLYPAAMCVRWSENNVVPSLSHSRIFNSSTTESMNVDCPVLHQNFDSSSGNNLDYAEIGMIDDNLNADVECRLASRHQEGSYLYGWTSAPVTTYSAGTHEQVKVLSYSTPDRHPDNWYYISCKVPPVAPGRTMSGITYYEAHD
jgi:hypothetical protein